VTVDQVVLNVASLTDTGLKRAANEDSLLTASPVFLVADGMGGHEAGDRASAAVVAAFEPLRGTAVTIDDVRLALGRATAVVESIAAAHKQGAGSTVSGVALVEHEGLPHWLVFNVGDSRVYRYADATISQVTVDHSEVQELQAAGRLTSEQARDYPRRNVITRSLGTDPPPEPDLWVFPPVPGERFLICSDGLTLELDDDEIARVLREHEDHQDAAEILVANAVSAGGRDNVTAIVVGLEVTPAASAVDGDTAPRNRDAKGR
jgi:PPM family protein phosphatase